MKIKYPAVLVAAIVHWILGAVWYGLFSKQFVALMEWTPEKMSAMENKSETKEFITAFVSSLILVYILAHFVQYTRARSALAGLQTAFWLWLGFIATTQIATVVFEGRKPGLYLLNIGYQLVACSIAAVILSIWRPRETTAQPA